MKPKRLHWIINCFLFSALCRFNFTASYKNQYAYKLEGFDPDWNYVGDLRFATFTNLDAGVYTFRVKASNNDDIWNEEGASLVIPFRHPGGKLWGSVRS